MLGKHKHLLISNTCIHDYGESEAYRDGKQSLYNLCIYLQGTERKILSILVEVLCEGLYTKEQIKDKNLVDKLIKSGFLTEDLPIESNSISTQDEDDAIAIALLIAAGKKLSTIDEQFNKYWQIEINKILKEALDDCKRNVSENSVFN